MSKKVIIFGFAILAVIIVFLNSHVILAQYQVSNTSAESEKFICNKVEEIASENRINDSTVSILNNTSKEVDIDNDGVLETFKYFPTRTFSALTEIRNGKRIGVPMGTSTTNYAGASIIRIDNKNYILHMVSSPSEKPYELVKVINARSLKVGNPYETETLCRFYKE